MAELQLNLTIVGIEEVNKTMLGITRRTIDPRPAHSDIADEMMRITDVQFRSQGRRGGGSWKRLSTKWMEYKVEQGYDLRTLHMKPGFPLRRSWTKRGDPNQILRITKKGVRLGSKVKYALIHQHGGGRNIPARPYWHLLENDLLRMTKKLQRYVMLNMRSK